MAFLVLLANHGCSSALHCSFSCVEELANRGFFCVDASEKLANHVALLVIHQ